MLPYPRSPSSSQCPPARLGNVPRSPRPRSFHFLSRSGLQQNRAARGPKSGKESAFPCRAASSPSPPPQSRPSQSQLQLFPFRLAFLLAAASGRRAARLGAGGRTAARLRVAVRARAASRRVGGWVGGWGRRRGEGGRGEREGCGEGSGRGREGGDSALLPLPAGAGGGGRRPRGGRGGREGEREGTEEDARITRAFRKARSTCTFLQARSEPFAAAAAAQTASSSSSSSGRRVCGCVSVCECVYFAGVSILILPSRWDLVTLAPYFPFPFFFPFSFFASPPSVATLQSLGVGERGSLPEPPDPANRRAQSRPPCQADRATRRSPRLPPSGGGGGGRDGFRR